MNNPDKNIVKFKDNEKYKVGAVTYDVTAHFNDEGEILKSKVSALLTEDIRKTNSCKNVENSHSNNV